MDVARLVLDFLKVLIWPATALVIVYGFRSQFRDLISRVRMLSGPGIDAEFSDQVIEASEDVEAAVLSNPRGDATGAQTPSEDGGEEPVSPDGVSTPSSDHHQVRGHYRTSAPEDDPLMALTETHPDAAVVAAFIGVESELRRLEAAARPAGARRLPIRQLVDALALPPDIRDSILEMSQLRSPAAHGEQVVSIRAARAFVRSCRELIDWLQSFGDQPRLF
ncbi:hypothetical protein [Streptomyces sp. NPDC056431]|uniref:hypothetical protein n=1 Tax=Streptomyces sp. NPDC056431 TaxID=3345814 RepID=UPI0036C50FE2